MKRTVLTVVLAVALAVISGTTVSHFLGKRLSDAQRATITANALADAANLRTANTLLTLSVVAAQRDSAFANAERSAASAAEREAALRARIAYSRMDSAYTLEESMPHVDSALAIIDDLQATNEALVDVIVTGWEVERALQETITDQQQALGRLQGASTDLVQASQKPFLAALLPEVGFGAAFGVSASTRRPDAVIGITLTWRP